MINLERSMRWSWQHLCGRSPGPSHPQYPKDLCTPQARISWLRGCNNMQYLQYTTKDQPNIPTLGFVITCVLHNIASATALRSHRRHRTIRHYPSVPRERSPPARRGQERSKSLPWDQSHRWCNSLVSTAFPCGRSLSFWSF